MSERKKFTVWVWLLAVAFWIAVPPLVLPYLVPSSMFYSPGSLYIEDSVVGVTPGIASSRVIHRPFIGRWQAQVYHVSHGGFERLAGCRHGSEYFQYRPDSRIDPEADLNWWLEIPPNPPCFMPAGSYMVSTTWYIRLPLLPWVSLNTSVDSNVFTISEPERYGIRR